MSRGMIQSSMELVRVYPLISKGFRSNPKSGGLVMGIGVCLLSPSISRDCLHKPKDYEHQTKRNWFSGIWFHKVNTNSHMQVIALILSTCKSTSVKASWQLSTTFRPDPTIWTQANPYGLPVTLSWTLKSSGCLLQGMYLLFHVKTTRVNSLGRLCAF